MLGIDFVREIKALSEETINDIQNTASAIGSLLGEFKK
jgi:hypothetical protein